MLYEVLINIIVGNHVSAKTFVSTLITLINDLTSDPSDVKFARYVSTLTTKYICKDIIILKI